MFCLFFSDYIDYMSVVGSETSTEVNPALWFRFVRAPSFYRLYLASEYKGKGIGLRTFVMI